MHKISNIPEVRISYGQVLAQSASRALADQYNLKLNDDSVYFKKTLEYFEAWKVKEAQILEALQEMLGVIFYLPVIDVTCLPFFVPQSNPVIMNFRETPDRFVDVLTHELCHLILIDNSLFRSYEFAPNYFISEDWAKMYGPNHDHKTLVHIPVHALCKYLWIDIMNNPSSYERDKAEVQRYLDNESYVKAWEYVDNHDYKKIVADLNKLYKELVTKNKQF
ncbi:hypothetical protein KA068_01480 [Candidatus Saccharibacteria bacterium]|jgi:hypothetical protein|nr:hypothetical protein [Candidatus Saccharibacteria bacterium]